MVADLLDSEKTAPVMIYQGRAGRRAAHIARSQLAVRLGIAVYAALCAAVALRCAVLTLGLPASVWSVGAILSAFVADRLAVDCRARRRPGRGRRARPLSDLTATLILLALPLALVGGGNVLDA